MDTSEMYLKSQITETQAAVSSIQFDLEGMNEKVRSSQTEILMINKNLAGSLKRYKYELDEVNKRSLLN